MKEKVLGVLAVLSIITAGYTQNGWFVFLALICIAGVYDA